VTAIGSNGSIAELTLGDGSTFEADGWSLPWEIRRPAQSGASLAERPIQWHLSPWFDDALRLRHPGERVLLVGTGLTAVDAALALQSQDAACQIHMLSRRGARPHVHSPGPRPPGLPISPTTGSARCSVNSAG